MRQPLVSNSVKSSGAQAGEGLLSFACDCRQPRQRLSTRGGERLWPMEATKHRTGKVEDEMVAAVSRGVTLTQRASRNTAARSALSKPPEQVDELDSHEGHPFQRRT